MDEMIASDEEYYESTVYPIPPKLRAGMEELCAPSPTPVLVSSSIKHWRLVVVRVPRAEEAVSGGAWASIPRVEASMPALRDGAGMVIPPIKDGVGLADAEPAGRARLSSGGPTVARPGVHSGGDHERRAS